ncbi:antitoxin Xre/MbcA/ParS toxin-binding domain-containing protein [Pseudoduganella violaceinigra]|uniref:antitoxin Xre/MbcA/ParS toxin-binding domain-containing protein n=1 Tax=Pseudoduganella violaceinigra TaxID=246602 RepID=UPI00048A2952|nr:antitoxin Xre/MbcA/ParS toxin-binding domain-containing protein [Pseudoduganella violaceinigra]
MGVAMSFADDLKPIHQTKEARNRGVESKRHSLWTTLTSPAGGPSKTSVEQLRALVARVREAPGVQLYDAVEAGVPTNVVKLIAKATGESTSVIMGFAGVSQTTFVRNEAAKKPLPDVAGHRIMAYLRLLATLRKMLDESGDPEQLRNFDLEGWFSRWIHTKLPELGDKSPAEMLRNPEGQRAVEQVLERMRGGLAA